MRLTKEVTEDLLKEVAGEDTIKLVGLLKNKDNISEFKLAEKLRVTVNTVRNMLYRLQEHNLVTSTRKKDKEKGWYIYYWTFNTSQARTLSRIVKQRKLERLRGILETETQEIFYVCPEKCTRFKIENAMEYSFTCPECGTILKEENNEAFIGKLRSTILGLEEELARPIINITRVKKITKAKIKKSVRKGRPKTIRRGRSKLVKRGRPKLVKVKRLKVNKKLKKVKTLGKIKKFKKVKKPKVKKFGKVRKIKKLGKPKVKRLKNVKKLGKIKKFKQVKKPKARKPKAKSKNRKAAKKPKTKKKTPVKKSKPKKRNMLRKVKRFLRRK